MQISFIKGGEELFNQVDDLWKKLNRHHYELATNHKEHYLDLTFADRIRMIQKQAAPGKIMVEIAKDETGTARAYCISLVDNNQRGELASIYVDSDLRGCGTGTFLAESSLQWMRSQDCKDIIVTVLPENHRALSFYSRFGFFQRLILMLLPESPGEETGGVA